MTASTCAAVTISRRPPRTLPRLSANVGRHRRAERRCAGGLGDGLLVRPRAHVSAKRSASSKFQPCLPERLEAEFLAQVLTSDDEARNAIRDPDTLLPSRS
jgi:hypothetical protein